MFESPEAARIPATARGACPALFVRPPNTAARSGGPSGARIRSGTYGCTLDRDCNELMRARATHTNHEKAHGTRSGGIRCDSQSALGSNYRADFRIAFAPYRCDIKFQMDAFNGSEKVVVIIYASRAATSAGGRPFIVEAVNADGLRPCDMLLMYVDEIRKELQRRKIPFTASLQWVHAQVLGLTLASGVAP